MRLDIRSVIISPAAISCFTSHNNKSHHRQGCSRQFQIPGRERLTMVHSRIWFSPRRQNGTGTSTNTRVIGTYGHFRTGYTHAFNATWCAHQKTKRDLHQHIKRRVSFKTTPTKVNRRSESSVAYAYQHVSPRMEPNEHSSTTQGIQTYLQNINNEMGLQCGTFNNRRNRTIRSSISQH